MATTEAESLPTMLKREVELVALRDHIIGSTFFGDVSHGYTNLVEHADLFVQVIDDELSKLRLAICLAYRRGRW